MPPTGVDSLDRSIGKAITWLIDVDEQSGTKDRRLAYRVTRAWLHGLRDRLTVEVTAHFAAQLPELLRGVFHDGGNPSRVPLRYGRDEYVARFARDARVRESDVARAAGAVTTVARRYMPGAVEQAFALLPASLRDLPESAVAGASRGNGAAPAGTGEQ